MVNIDIEDSGRWRPLFRYESILLDIDIEYAMTYHRSGEYSLSIRDAKKDFLLVEKYREFKTLEECEEYLSNYYERLFELSSYVNQLGF